ncbi:hypothetical protein B0T11DRAFT_75239 [Plectosphaerella cucumerina]|uniref:Uncharacterized protein n=1 Tax=Plectosphaerella cucumerina TaxID=40658 RepID=A0A8K0TEW8_9PEZI|nr:hypothetical protein B0T11DRAFT_75239 [Plectosphaerella cucumerina]
MTVTVIGASVGSSLCILVWFDKFFGASRYDTGQEPAQGRSRPSCSSTFLLVWDFLLGNLVAAVLSTSHITSGLGSGRLPVRPAQSRYRGIYTGMKHDLAGQWCNVHRCDVVSNLCVECCLIHWMMTSVRFHGTQSSRGLEVQPAVYLCKTSRSILELRYRGGTV